MKKLLTLLAFPTLLCLMPLTAWAQIVNNVFTYENITKTSTVYAGEVVVDGVTKIKYLYSEDMTTYNTVIQNLLVGLNGMADTAYAALLKEHRSGLTQTKGLALCDDPELAEAMDGNWSSAQYVGTLYFPDKSVVSETNSNLYDIDEGFKAAVDARNEEIRVDIENLADVEKCIVSHLDVNITDNVYYTIEDGQVVKHVDSNVVYDTEATTVIYTKVELASKSTSSILGDVNGDGTVSVTDVAWIVNHILGIVNDNFIIANADVNGDGEIDVNDVMATVKKILEGDTEPQSYLTCPDDHHPHLINLGLPSGTLWACCNVGATNPEDKGLFFSWGDTEGHGSDPSDGYLFSWENYKWGEVIGGETFFTKYCTDSSFGKDGFTDGKYELDLEDDAAYINWGSGWRTPSKEQFDELKSECTWTLTTVGDVKGYEVKGKEGSSIFLPETGWRLDDMLLDGGAYWSRSANPESTGVGGAYYLGWDDWGEYEYGGRVDGQCVRPVSK